MMFQAIVRRLRKRCPRCEDGRLIARDWVRATCKTPDGRRYPDSWTYAECDRCGARLKIHLDGNVVDPPDEEWSEFAK